MAREPFNCILNYDIDGLCRFVAHTPIEDWGVSDSGRSPIQVAYHKGSGLLAAIIVAKYPECLNEVNWNYGKLIQVLIEEFSEESLCSGWNDNIECELWAIVNNEYMFTESDRLDWLPECAKEAILKVAQTSGIWVAWRSSMKSITEVPLSNWHEIYADWKATANQ
jgi:hypothetical protein